MANCQSDVRYVDNVFNLMPLFIVRIIDPVVNAR